MLEDLFINIMSAANVPMLYAAAVGAMWVSAIVILVSVIYKFDVAAQQSIREKKTTRHLIETFSMGAVVVVVFNLLQLNRWTLNTDTWAQSASFFFGLLLVVVNTVLHLWSKRDIGRFWSNQIVIQKDHHLITEGSFDVVRHPAYSSLLFWLVGLSFLFANYGALFITAFVFFPMLASRATAEDKALKALDATSFGIYRDNRRQLFPAYSETVSLLFQLTSTVCLGFAIVTADMSLDRVILISAFHLVSAMVISPDKVRFAYRNKAVFLLIIFGLTLWAPVFHYLYVVPFALNVWGLFFNCPCMVVYERYQRCICFSWLKQCRLK